MLPDLSIELIYSFLFNLWSDPFLFNEFAEIILYPSLNVTKFDS
jgi:hypothetical protein